MLDNVLMFPQYPQFPHKYTIWNWQTMYIFQHLISIIYSCSVCTISGDIFWTILKPWTWKSFPFLFLLPSLCVGPPLILVDLGSWQLFVGSQTDPKGFHYNNSGQFTYNITFTYFITVSDTITYLNKEW